VILGPLEVLNRINANCSTSSLPFEVIISITNRKEIFVSWVPADTCDILSLCLFCVDSAEKTDMSLWFVDVVPRSIVKIISVVIKNFFLFVLDNSSLHNLKASFKTCRVQRLRPLIRSKLALCFFSFILILKSLFSLIFFFESLHIGIEDHPLICLELNPITVGRTRRNTLFPDFVIQGLTLTFTIVEFVSDGLFESF